MSEAIALDSGFAMAYRKLAVELGNRALQRPREEALLQKAYDNMERLSETERYIMLGSYYMSGPKPDNAKAIAALESLLDIDSVNVTALNNLSSLYHDRGEYAKAADLAGRAIAVQPTAAVFFNNRMENLLHLGKIAEAETTLAVAARNLPRNPQVPLLRSQFLFEQSKTDSAEAVLDSLGKARPNDLPTGRSVSFTVASFRQMQGRLAEYLRLMANGRQLARQLGNPQAMINVILDTAYLASFYRNDNATAIRVADRAAANRLFDSLPPERRPYPFLITTYANAGRPDKAKGLLQEYAALEINQTTDAKRALQRFYGLISRAERRYDEAIREFQAVDPEGCPDCILPDVAMAYDMAGNADSAIALLTRFTEARAIPVATKATWYAFSLRRLGELHDAKGNFEQAISNYAQFVELWKNADAELQPQVQKARDRMRELQRRRG
jgi:tetratricopeptide (TPR) repeat protein